MLKIWLQQKVKKLVLFWYKRLPEIITFGIVLKPNNDSHFFILKFNALSYTYRLSS